MSFSKPSKAGLFDFIITKEISRFSRSTLDSIKYTQELLGNGVGVFFQNDNINTLDTDSEFRLVIMAGVTQCSDLLLYLDIYNRKLVKESGKMDKGRGIGYQ